VKEERPVEESVGGEAEVAVRATGVSKRYELYDRPQDRLKQAIFRQFQRLLRKPGRIYAHEFWALKDVSFEVRKGETVGIIGRNGSGKSTLLQIVAGTLDATQGDIQVHGRVAALLELGSGFNPEFTGRENVYINGAIQGLSKKEIDERFDEIAGFADIGQFMEQPLKTFSSGMYVRLAFAVAVSVLPDLLIVDEALAVGDIAFQAKCMARIRNMMSCGATVLFVSQDIGAVKALCNRCLYLEAGRTVSYGRVADVTGLYIQRSHLEINAALSGEMSKKSTSQESTEKITSAFVQHTGASAPVIVRTDAPVDFGPTVNRYGDGRVTILDVKLLGERGTPTEQLELDEDFEVQISVRVQADMPNIAWGYSMRDLKGQMLIGMMSTSDPALGILPCKRGDSFVFGIKGSNPLQAGVYTLSVGIELPVMTNRQHVFLEVVENVLIFKSVWPADSRLLSPGIVKVPVQFTILGFDERVPPLS
jgi:lipopolysaccharide transport system ATP-binding protein